MTSSQQFAQLLGAINSSRSYLPEKFSELALVATQDTLKPPTPKTASEFGDLLKGQDLAKASFTVKHMESNFDYVQPDNVRSSAPKLISKDIG